MFLSFLFYVDLPRNLSNAFRLMLFYCAGYYCKELGLLDNVQGLKCGIAAVIAVVVSMICTFYSSSWQGQKYIVVTVSALAGIYVIIFAAKKTETYIHGRTRNIVLYVGQSTLPILALHLFCNCFVKAIYVTVYGFDSEMIATTAKIPDYRWSWVYVIVGLAGSILLYKAYVCCKIFLSMELRNK